MPSAAKVRQEANERKFSFSVIRSVVLVESKPSRNVALHNGNILRGNANVFAPKSPKVVFSSGIL
jgi:hypothetical protein